MRTQTAYRAFILGGAAFALSIALCLALAVCAHASNPASTDYYIQADDSQISWSVPINVHFSVNPNGTFRAADNGTFLNNSVFSIYIKTATVTPASGVTIVPSTSSGAAADSIWTVLTASGGESIATAKMDIYDYIGGSSGNFASMGWKMAGATHSPANSITIAYQGAISEFGTIEPASDLAYANIAWIAAAAS